MTVVISSFTQKRLCTISLSLISETITSENNLQGTSSLPLKSAVTRAALMMQTIPKELVMIRYAAFAACITFSSPRRESWKTLENSVVYFEDVQENIKPWRLRRDGEEEEDDEERSPVSKPRVTDCLLHSQHITKTWRIRIRGREEEEEEEWWQWFANQQWVDCLLWQAMLQLPHEPWNLTLSACSQSLAVRESNHLVCYLSFTHNSTNRAEEE